MAFGTTDPETIVSCRPFAMYSPFAEYYPAAMTSGTAAMTESHTAGMWLLRAAIS